MKVKSWLLVIILQSGLHSAAEARYYDPNIGRFISADEIVQDGLDPQAYNRYAYVRNNPVLLTDPSGNSWLSNIVDKNSETLGLSLQIFDPFLGSIQLARTEEGRAILVGQTIAAASFGYGGTATGWGAVSGELSSYILAKQTDGDLMRAMVRGGLEGAAIGYAFSGISNGKGSWIGKGILKSNIIAGITYAHGGDRNAILRSWGITFGAEAANAYFTNTVGAQSDPTPGIPLDKSKNHYYKPNKFGQPKDLTKNVIGYNNGNGGFFHQGGPVSNSLNLLPGMNSVAQLHDTWMNINSALIFGNSTVSNFSTMAPALITSYAAQFSGPWAPIISNTQGGQR